MEKGGNVPSNIQKWTRIKETLALGFAAPVRATVRISGFDDI